MILGIDIGGSTTKIVGLSDGGEPLDMKKVSASDRETSLYGALGAYLSGADKALSDVDGIVMTGVGAPSGRTEIFGIPARSVPEFSAIGRGGLRLSGLDRALVVSMGTGTAFVYAGTDGSKHVGGIGLGGGTLVGLADKLIGDRNVPSIAAAAMYGDLSGVDLTVGDISPVPIPSLPSYATAANFGKIKTGVSSADLALGLINMIFQTIGTMAVFACREHSLGDVVLTGALAALPQTEKLFGAIAGLYGVRFHIAENPVFATALGAAMLG